MISASQHFIVKIQPCFLNLFPQIKRLILKRIDFGSRCDLSLVREDLMEEFGMSVEVNINPNGIVSAIYSDGYLSLKKGV